MKYIRLAVAICGLLWLAACSSTGNVGSNSQADRGASEQFSVSTEPGNGTFSPSLDVHTTGEGVTVTVTANNAVDLSAAYLHLQYDAKQYTPVSVQFGNFLGTQDQVLSLGLTDVSGDVPLGVVQTAVGGASPQNGSGLIATVTFKSEPFTASRGTSTFPKGSANAVADLEIVDFSAQEVDLHWTERNKGDFDNNGRVSISDLTPLGSLFGQKVNEAADPIYAGMVDGDGNGLISISDLAVIGANFENQITGYWLYCDCNGETPLVFIPRPTTFNPKAPVEYTYVVTDPQDTDQFVVRGTGTTQQEQGAISNIALVVIVPGPPDPPTSLIKQTGVGVGHLKVRLSWQASPSGDVKGYMIERKLHTDPDTSYADLLLSPYNGTIFTDQTGLTDEDYDYRVRAVDKESPAETSTYSNVVMAHPYFRVLNPPINVNAAPGGGSSAITITWNAPADGSADRFTLYRQAPGEPGFTPIFTTINSAITDYVDRPLTVGQDYNYYLTSRDAFLSLESVPSATSTSQCSAAIAFEILSLTTDKTTHYQGGDPNNAVSTINVTTSTPADSFQWASSQGSVNGSGDTVTWKPGAGATPGAVTITCTAIKGAEQAVQTVKLYVTEETIKTNLSPTNDGHFKDFNNLPSVLQPNAPYRPLSYYVNKDHVVFYNLWGIWCYWCKWELGDVAKLQQYYGADGFQYVGDDDSGSESIASIKQFYDQNGYSSPTLDPPFESYSGVDPSWPKYAGGSISGYPTTVLFDRDGNIRAQQVGALSGATLVHWSNVVSQLTGHTPAKTTGFDH